MSKRLTIDQLIMMEKLTGKEHTITGVVRKKPRTRVQSAALNIPQSHHNEMKELKLNLTGIKSQKLKDLLLGFYSEKGVI